MKRPNPSEVVAVVERLALTTQPGSVAAIVAELRKAFACSRATGYRAISDAFRDGVIGHAPSHDDAGRGEASR
jgi:hypothetical protein